MTQTVPESAPDADQVDIDAAGIAAPTPAKRQLLPRRRSVEFDSTALVLSGLINGALGLIFWAAAARVFPESDVGRAGAVINTAIMLATLANLSFGPMYERFLPQSGRLSQRLIVSGQAITGLTAFLLGVGFVFLGPTDRLFHSDTDALLFPFYVMVLSAFALADSVLIGMRAGRWAAAKNIFHAVAKLAVLVALAAAAMPGANSIVLSWLVPAAVAVIVVQSIVMIAGRGLSRGKPRLPSVRSLWAYFGGTYGVEVLSSITPLVLPLIVIVSVGAEHTAYFNITWTLVGAILMGTGMVAGPFIAEVAAHPERLATLLRRFIRLLSIVFIVGALALAIGGPIALWIVGQSYSDNGSTLVRLMALVQLLDLPGTLFGVLCRIHRTMRYAVGLQVMSTVGVVGLAYLAVPHWGIDGVGYAYLGVQIVTTIAIAYPLYRRLRIDLGAKS